MSCHSRWHSQQILADIFFGNGRYATTVFIDVNELHIFRPDIEHFDATLSSVALACFLLYSFLGRLPIEISPIPAAADTPAIALPDMPLKAAIDLAFATWPAADSCHAISSAASAAAAARLPFSRQRRNVLSRRFSLYFRQPLSFRFQPPFLRRRFRHTASRRL